MSGSEKECMDRMDRERQSRSACCHQRLAEHLAAEDTTAVPGDLTAPSKEIPAIRAGCFGLEIQTLEQVDE
jgi:hypothetical protein